MILASFVALPVAFASKRTGSQQITMDVATPLIFSQHVVYKYKPCWYGRTEGIARLESESGYQLKWYSVNDVNQKFQFKHDDTKNAFGFGRDATYAFADDEAGVKFREQHGISERTLEEAHEHINLSFEDGHLDYYPLEECYTANPRYILCISNGKDEVGVQFKTENEMIAWANKLTLGVYQLLKDDPAALKKFIKAQEWILPDVKLLIDEVKMADDDFIADRPGAPVRMCASTFKKKSAARHKMRTAHVKEWTGIIADAKASI